MNMNVGMIGEELPDSLGLVRRQVVGDNVNLLVRWLVSQQVGQESHELFAGVSCSSFAQNLAGFRIQGRIERECAMAVVLETVTFSSAWRKREYRNQTVQGLDGRLFIDAKYGRMLRRIDVESQ